MVVALLFASRHLTHANKKLGGNFGNANSHNWRESNSKVIESNNRGYNEPGITHAHTLLVGCNVELKKTDGHTYQGVFDISRSNEIGLSHATLTGVEDGSVTPPVGKEEMINKLIIPFRDIVFIKAANVDLDYAKKDNVLLTDAAITGNNRIRKEKELEPWKPEDADLDNALNELTFENGTYDASTNWAFEDMIRINEEKHGIKSSFDGSMEDYMTPIEKRDDAEYKEQEKMAEKLAREIEQGDHYKEREQVDSGMTEEVLFSSVERNHDIQSYKNTFNHVDGSSRNSHRTSQRGKNAVVGPRLQRGSGRHPQNHDGHQMSMNRSPSSPGGVPQRLQNGIVPRNQQHGHTNQHASANHVMHQQHNPHHQQHSQHQQHQQYQHHNQHQQHAQHQQERLSYSALVKKSMPQRPQPQRQPANWRQANMGLPNVGEMNGVQSPNGQYPPVPQNNMISPDVPYDQQPAVNPAVVPQQGVPIQQQIAAPQQAQKQPPVNGAPQMSNIVQAPPQPQREQAKIVQQQPVAPVQPIANIPLAAVPQQQPIVVAATVPSPQRRLSNPPPQPDPIAKSASPVSVAATVPTTSATVTLPQAAALQAAVVIATAGQQAQQIQSLIQSQSQQPHPSPPTQALSSTAQPTSQVQTSPHVEVVQPLASSSPPPRIPSVSPDRKKVLAATNSIESSPKGADRRKEDLHKFGKVKQRSQSTQEDDKQPSINELKAFGETFLLRESSSSSRSRHSTEGEKRQGHEASHHDNGSRRRQSQQGRDSDRPSVRPERSNSNSSTTRPHLEKTVSDSRSSTESPLADISHLPNISKRIINNEVPLEKLLDSDSLSPTSTSVPSIPTVTAASTTVTQPTPRPTTPVSVAATAVVSSAAATPPSQAAASTETTPVSKKSTLNPAAKEFTFNPKAAEFSPRSAISPAVPVASTFPAQQQQVQQIHQPPSPFQQKPMVYPVVPVVYSAVPGAGQSNIIVAHSSQDMSQTQNAQPQVQPAVPSVSYRPTVAYRPRAAYQKQHSYPPATIYSAQAGGEFQPSGASAQVISPSTGGFVHHQQLGHQQIVMVPSHYPTTVVAQPGQPPAQIFQVQVPTQTAGSALYRYIPAGQVGGMQHMSMAVPGGYQNESGGYVVGGVVQGQAMPSNYPNPSPSPQAQQVQQQAQYVHQSSSSYPQITSPVNHVTHQTNTTPSPAPHGVHRPLAQQLSGGQAGHPQPQSYVMIPAGQTMAAAQAYGHGIMPTYQTPN